MKYEEEQMLDDYGLNGKTEAVREWYDGFTKVISFGICFCKKSCIVGLMEK